MDPSILTRLFGPVYLDPSIWTHLFRPVYLDYYIVHYLTQTHVLDLHDGQRLVRQPQQHILRLQVPVTDLLEVQVLDGQGNLEEVQLSLGLVFSMILSNSSPPPASSSTMKRKLGVSITSSRLVMHGWFTD